MKDLTAGQKAVRAEVRRLRRRLRELDAAVGMTQSGLPPEERARQIAAQMREREAVREALRQIGWPSAG